MNIPMNINDQLLHYLYVNRQLPVQFNSIDMDDLFDICVNRVKAYQAMEQYIVLIIISPFDRKSIGIQTQEANQHSHFISEVQNILDKQKLILYPYDQYEQYKDQDIVSFRFLQICYSTTDDNIKKFVRYEKWILESRLKKISNIEKDTKKIFDILNIPLSALTNEEYNKYRDQLIQATGALFKKDTIDNFYKLNFINCLDALSQLRIFLVKGNAYIHIKDLFYSVIDNYSTKLNEKLQNVKSQDNYQEIIQDEKIVTIKDLLLNLDTAFDYDYKKIQKGTSTLTLENIELVQKQLTFRVSFPLCMKYLNDKLGEVHHLKHFGRLQLGLFLKGAGLQLDEALHYWKSKFAPKYSATDFDKNYSYNIRHNYGTEGKRTDYTPQSCKMIISSNAPGSNDEYHGCPFKHFNDENLKRYLSLNGVSFQEINEIIALKQGHHYQLACQKTWKAKHPKTIQKLEDELNVIHPLEYFRSSRLYYEEEEKINTEK